MSLFKRITTTVSTTVERAVNKVENHDAIINAALRETQSAAARSRVRLSRVRKDGESLKTRRKELKTAVSQWTQRATDAAQSDESRALECLRRKNECEARLRALEDSIEKHGALENQVAENLKKIEDRIAEVSQQRNMMRSRQSVAEAMRVIHTAEGVSFGAIEDTFDRWEVNLGETEVLMGPSVQDPLEAEFLREEDETELRAELDALLRANSQQGDDSQNSEPQS